MRYIEKHHWPAAYVLGRGGFRGGGGAMGAEAPPLLGYHLKNYVKSGWSGFTCKRASEDTTLPR